MQTKFFEKNKDLGLLIIRVGLGLTFVFIHGGPKILGGPAKWATYGLAAANVGLAFWPTFWGFMCAVIEFFGGLCLLVGYKVRIVCLLMIPNMLVALTYMMKANPMNASYPLEIGVVFAALFFLGSGKYGIEKD